jgi:hypothetical protein
MNKDFKSFEFLDSVRIRGIKKSRLLVKFSAKSLTFVVSCSGMRL